MKRLHERNGTNSISFFKNLRQINRKNRLIFLLSFCILVLIVSYLSGYSSSVVNAFPVFKFGERVNTLSCTYSGQSISTDVKTHSNINTYYKNLSSKNKYINNTELAGMTLSSKNDGAIKNLANNIKTIADSKNLNDDQLVELTTCLVQNIPYDENKANLVLSKSTISNRELAQFPYETLYKNSGICTDKTYLASAILKELGFGTGILIFPDEKHMALGIKAPSGYTDFKTDYAYMEVTTSGFAPGEIPEDINNTNGKAAVAIKSISDLSTDSDPSKVDYYSKKSISSPNLVIEVNDGKKYQRIVEVTNLENKIITGLDQLSVKNKTLEIAYGELLRRKSAQQYAYTSYLSEPSTKLDCGYKYNYSYSWSMYSYSPMYTYQCDTVTNYNKTYKYSSYSLALSSYNYQVSYYNSLLDNYNKSSSTVKADINKYKSYNYN